MESRKKNNKRKEKKSEIQIYNVNDGSSSVSDDDIDPKIEKSQLLARLDEMKLAIDGYKELKARSSSRKRKPKSPCQVQ